MSGKAHVVSLADLGADFDAAGAQVTGKINVVAATNAVAGKVKFATSAQLAAGASFVAVDAAALLSAVSLLSPAAGGTIKATSFQAGIFATSYITPSISVPYGGQTTLNVLSIAAQAAQSSGAEAACTIALVSSTGGGSVANATENYKACLQLATNANPGSASTWCIVAGASMQAGAGNIGCIGFEIDLNNSNQSYPAVPTNPYTANLYLTGTNGGGTGSGTTGAPPSACFTSNAALIVTFGENTSAMWQSGLIFQGHPLGGSPFNIAAIADYSNSPNIILAQGGTHSYGINFANATFTGDAIITPGFSVGGTGVVTSSETVLSTGSYPKLVWTATNNATDAKSHQSCVDPNGNFFLTTVNDAGNVASTALEVIRGASATITSIALGAPTQISAGYTCAQLTALTGIPTGSRAYVTDAPSAAPTFMAAVGTGGGSTTAPVTKAASGWIYG